MLAGNWHTPGLEIHTRDLVIWPRTAQNNQGSLTPPARKQGGDIAEKQVEDGRTGVASAGQSTAHDAVVTNSKCALASVRIGEVDNEHHASPSERRRRQIAPSYSIYRLS